MDPGTAFLFLAMSSLCAAMVLSVASQSPPAGPTIEEDRRDLLDQLQRKRGGQLISSEGAEVIQGPIWAKAVAGGMISAHYFRRMNEKGMGVAATRFLFRAAGGRTLPRCRIYRATSLSTAAKFLGMQDIEVGDPELDTLFVLQAADIEWMRRILSPSLRERLRHLSKLDFEAVNIWTYGDTLEMRLEVWVGFEGLLDMCDAGEMLVDAIMSGGGQAPVATDQLEFKPTATSYCLVCGESLVERPVIACDRCHTPHHAECWEYNGSCAVYACRTRR